MVKNIKLVAMGSIGTSMILGAVGQMFIKKGLNSLGNLEFSKGLFTSYVKIFFSPLVVVGLFTYFIGVFFWLYGLSKVDLSFAFPFVSLSYVLVFLLSWWVLGEELSMLRWTGLCVICLGVLLVGKS